MTQEEKQLLFQYLSAALFYGVKILHEGWDSDSDTDFDTVETLIGIDDKFIYTIWDKTGSREKHCLSVSNWKPYLRPMSSMSDEEKKELLQISNFDSDVDDICYGSICCIERTVIEITDIANFINWLLKKHFDFMGLIPMGLALEAPEGMYKKGE